MLEHFSSKNTPKKFPRIENIPEHSSTLIFCLKFDEVVKKVRIDDKSCENY